MSDFVGVFSGGAIRIPDHWHGCAEFSPVVGRVGETDVSGCSVFSFVPGKARIELQDCRALFEGLPQRQG
ncbi:MAG: hypothetical protein AAFW98_03680 [Pseudomonadota bacterium]